MKHRVFAKFLGKTAFVHSFDNPTEAAELTIKLRMRYGPKGAKFNHFPEDIKTTARWADMRDALGGGPKEIG